MEHGHAIGNHTHNHLNGWKTNFNQYLENVALCDTELKNHTPDNRINPSLFRPPYGRITRKQIAGLPRFKIIMWDVLTIDYNMHLSKENCLMNSIRATRDGSIIVFHDSLKAAKNLTYALPRFIEHFSAQDYEFTIIPDGKDPGSAT